MLSTVSVLGVETFRKRLAPEALLHKWVFILVSTLTDRFPEQPDVEDMEDTKIFPSECANSRYLSLTSFLFTVFSYHTNPRHQIFQQILLYFIVLIGYVWTFVFNPCPMSWPINLFNFYTVYIQFCFSCSSDLSLDVLYFFPPERLMQAVILLTLLDDLKKNCILKRVLEPVVLKSQP